MNAAIVSCPQSQFSAPYTNQPKLPKAARAFYQASKVEHLMTAVRACEAMSSNPAELHSRKLRRPVGEVAFR